MRAFWVLLRRELVARRALLVTSIGIGLLTAITPWLSGSSASHAAETRGAAAVCVALVWGLLLALGLGATCLARDLGERRLTFDLRLPAPATAVWGARLLAAALTVLAATALVVLVAAPFGLDLESASAGVDVLVQTAAQGMGVYRVTGSLLWVPALLGALLLLANQAGLVLFGRHVWSGLDLVSVLIAVFGNLLVTSNYRLWGADAAARTSVLSFVTVVLAGLLVASWWQVSGGRSEPGRAHARASTALLAAVVVGAAGALLAFQVYVHPSLSKLASPALVTLLGDDLAALSARVPGRATLYRFVIDRRQGSFLRLGPGVDPAPPIPQGSSLVYATVEPKNATAIFSSRDGSRVVWLETERSGLSELSYRAFELSRRTGRLHRLPLALSWSEPPLAAALSPDGRTLATRWSDKRHMEGDGRILFEETSTGRTTKVFEVQRCGQAGPLGYLGADWLRVACGLGNYAIDSPVPIFELRELHLPSGTQRTTTGNFASDWLTANWPPYLREIRGPGWVLQVHRSGPDGRRSGWELLSTRPSRAAFPLPEWSGEGTGPWPADGMALAGDRILVLLAKEPRSVWKQVGGRWVPTSTTPGWSEVLVLSTDGQAIHTFRFEQRLLRILSVEDGGASAIVVGDRRNWDSYSGQSQVAYRVHLDTGELEPATLSGPWLPVLAVPASGIATRDPSGNWIIQSGRGMGLLFLDRGAGAPPPPASERSTGQTTTNLKTR